MKIKPKIGITTLVGTLTNSPFPQEFGNCFSLIINEKQYHVANMLLENFEHIVKQYNLQEINVKLEDNVVLIEDEHFPTSFYRIHPCSCCNSKIIDKPIRNGDDLINLIQQYEV